MFQMVRGSRFLELKVARLQVTPPSANTRGFRDSPHISCRWPMKRAEETPAQISTIVIPASLPPSMPHSFILFSPKQQQPPDLKHTGQMAAPSLVAAEALPKFLLPRLSWKTTGPLATTTARSFSRDQARWQQPTVAASFYSTTPTRPRTQKRTKEHSSILGRASFHTTAPRARDHHFDTLKFVQRLQDEGFTEEQSSAMMKVLNDVIEER